MEFVSGTAVFLHQAVGAESRIIHEKTTRLRGALRLSSDVNVKSAYPSGSTSQLVEERLPRTVRKFARRAFLGGFSVIVAEQSTQGLATLREVLDRTQHLGVSI